MSMAPSVYIGAFLRFTNGANPNDLSLNDDVLIPCDRTRQHWVVNTPHQSILVIDPFTTHVDQLVTTRAFEDCRQSLESWALLHVAPFSNNYQIVTGVVVGWH